MILERDLQATWNVVLPCPGPSRHSRSWGTGLLVAYTPAHFATPSRSMLDEPDVLRELQEERGRDGLDAAAFMALLAIGVSAIAGSPHAVALYGIDLGDPDERAAWRAGSLTSSPTAFSPRRPVPDAEVSRR